MYGHGDDLDENNRTQMPLDAFFEFQAFQPPLCSNAYEILILVGSVMQQSQYLVVKPITINNFSSLFKCTPIDR